MKENKISVIIPAYNEEKNIAVVLNIVKKYDKISEIIVVDNACTDKTAEISRDLGAKVVECHVKGKGYAMEKGVEEARGDIIVFLDADVLYQDNIIELLVEPILSGRADFVKSTFNRTCRRSSN